jgi:hypothetical protein
MMQFTEKGKWTAWESQKGKDKEVAMKEYVQAFFAVSVSMGLSVLLFPPTLKGRNRAGGNNTICFD